MVRDLRGVWEMSLHPANVRDDVMGLSPLVRRIIVSALAPFIAYGVVNGGFWLIHVMRGNMNDPSSYLAFIAPLLALNLGLYGVRRRRYWSVNWILTASLFVFSWALMGFRSLLWEFPYTIYFVLDMPLFALCNAVLVAGARRALEGPTLG